MGAFGGLVLTIKGRNLQAKVQAGQQLKFSRMGLGDGIITSQSIPNMTGLITERKSITINRVYAPSAGRATVSAILSNQDITTGFFFRELGVFAIDPDEGEIMYAYGNSGSGSAEYIPPVGGADIVEKLINVNLLVGNVANISITADPSQVYVSIQDLEEVLQESKEYTDTQIANVKVPDASLTQKGIVQLTNATNSTSETLVPTAKAVKDVRDFADAGLRQRGQVPTNWNSATSLGVYTAAIDSWSGYTNYPAGAYGYGVLVVENFVGGACQQTYYTHDNPGKIYARISFGGNNWRAWTEVITTNTSASWQKYKLTTDVATNILYINGDLNNLIKNGFYAGENLANCPIGTAAGTWAYIEVMSLDEGSGYVIQKLYNLHGDASFYMRTRRSNVWGPWSQDLFTSVASGKGDIAGAIIDRGGNANASNTFPELVTAIRNLPGKRFASGIFNSQSANGNQTSGAELTLSASNLGFTPSMIFVRIDLTNTAGTVYLSGIVQAGKQISGVELKDGGFNNYVRSTSYTQSAGGFSTLIISGILRTGGANGTAVLRAYEWWAYE
ncbi:tail fiber protein [Paenibacillus kribbensis]|uniref:tail fiber protein n=1 Tax=Paenibacillus kribbensis TaxID=172713 RepID=UPI002DBF6D12|nr:tail fiber protein [Paenibacillus kribbensis]MEC0234085.1 tail fiber protein [Paenibacillus kribbensis]